MILEYYKIRENAKTPQRANPSDAGLDVFWCPTNQDIQDMDIPPENNHMFETGLKFGIPHGYALLVCNRSGIAANASMVYGAHVIDSGYNGEVFIDLHNIGDKTVRFKPGQKIAQLLLVPVVPFRLSERSEDNLYRDQITISNRGEGSLGSTDEKQA